MKSVHININTTELFIYGVFVFSDIFFVTVAFFLIGQHIDTAHSLQRIIGIHIFYGHQQIICQSKVFREVAKTAEETCGRCFPAPVLGESRRNERCIECTDRKKELLKPLLSSVSLPEIRENAVHEALLFAAARGGVGDGKNRKISADLPERHAARQAPR